MGLIPDEIIQQVLDRNDIVATVAGYIPLKKAGRNFKALCPFHQEKTPSFVVNPDKQIFHCFGCSAGGNAIAFVMKQEHLEFPEAVESLARKVGIELPRERDPQAQVRNNLRQSLWDINELAASFFHEQLMASQTPSAKSARDYLKGRRVSPEMAKKFRLGFAPDGWEHLMNFLRGKGVSLGAMEKAGLIIPRESKEGFYDRFRNRITFPVFDVRNRCVAFGARTLEKEAGAKYINSPETAVYTKGQHLYGFNLSKDAVAQKDAVIVVEGYMDFMMPFAAGVENIVASSGTALTVEQIRLIHRYTENVVMLFDADQAGEAATVRSLDLLVEEGMNVRVATLTPGEDPDSFVSKFGPRTFAERIERASSLFDYKLEWLKGKFDGRSVEGKARIAREMLFTLVKFSNEIVRSGYLQRLSEALGVAQEALQAEMRKILATERSSAVSPVFPAPPQANRAVETNILKLLLEEEGLIAETRSEVTLEHFQDERVRSVIDTIFVLFSNGKSVDVAFLLNSFQDERIKQMLSGLAAEELPESTDRKKIHRDCLNRLKENRVRSVRQELIEKIRQAEGAGDNERVSELTEQFNQIMKRP